MKNNTDFLSLVSIPGGIILMRDDRKKQQWPVVIQSFYLGKYPITQSQYQRICSDNPASFSGADKPVECVSWYDALEFCNALSEQEGLTPVFDIQRTAEQVTCIPKANGYRLSTETGFGYRARVHGRY